MPSVGCDPRSPVQPPDDDIVAVRVAVLKEFEVGKDIMVVSHSWNCISVSGVLGKKERETNGDKGEVVKIAYTAALWLQRAQSS